MWRDDINGNPLEQGWGELASKVVHLARTNPALWEPFSLVSAADLHAVAIWLLLGPGETAPNNAAADALANTAARELLNQTVPALPELYGLLSRLMPRAHERTFYERLIRQLRGPFAAELRAYEQIGNKELNRITLLEKLDPLAQPFHRVLPMELGCLGPVDTLVRFLRAYGSIRDDELPPAFDADAGPQAAFETMIKWLDRATAPEPDFVPKGGLKCVQTIGELRAIGQRLNSGSMDDIYLLADRLIDMVTGHRCYMALEQPVLTLVCLERHGRDLWSLGEIATVGPGVGHRAAEAALIESGLSLLRTTPRDALRSFLQTTEPREVSQSPPRLEKLWPEEEGW